MGSRRCAYQVMVVDELKNHDAEVVFLNRAIGAGPEEDLLLQMQGMFAEYERAKIMERIRCGKRLVEASTFYPPNRTAIAIFRNAKVPFMKSDADRQSPQRRSQRGWTN